jgi:hypothetical protein
MSAADPPEKPLPPEVIETLDTMIQNRFGA